MEGAPNKEKAIIQSAEQPTQDLHAVVSSKLTEAGHPATPQSVNPDDQSPLEEIARKIGDATHVVGSAIEENLGGASPTTHVRTTGGEEPISIARKRSGLQKAA